MSINRLDSANIQFDPESAPEPNPTVQGVQKGLNRLPGGGSLREDGVFDAPTSHALRQFQQVQQLEVTGAINQPTIEALNRLSSPPPATSSAASAGSEGTVLGALGRLHENNLEGLALRGQLEKVLEKHLAGAESGAGPGAAGEGQLLPAIQRDSLMGDGSVRFHPREGTGTIIPGPADDLNPIPSAGRSQGPASPQLTITAPVADDLKNLSIPGAIPSPASSQVTITIRGADDLSSPPAGGLDGGPASTQNTIGGSVADDLNEIPVAGANQGLGAPQLTVTIRTDDEIKERG